MITILDNKMLHSDIAMPWQFMFQDSASEGFEYLVNLHNIVVYYLVIVTVLVTWGMLVTLYKGSENNSLTSQGIITSKYLTHGTLLELIWTITPAFVLLAIAVPSFNLLYLSDEVLTPTLTIKTIGHQWYWSYEYTDVTNADGEGIEFDSYMVPTEDLEDGQFRLLEVDTPVVLPYNVNVRFIITGVDVIHDFAVPALGIKLDATPGRLNQISLVIDRVGTYFGQCSELCGAYHGFIPIQINAVTVNEFIEWVEEQLE